jgi:hypothetical protein
MHTNTVVFCLQLFLMQLPHRVNSAIVLNLISSVLDRQTLHSISLRLVLAFISRTFYLLVFVLTGLVLADLLHQVLHDCLFVLYVLHLDAVNLGLILLFLLLRLSCLFRLFVQAFAFVT